MKAAKHARCAFDDRPRRDGIDWNDGFDDGTRASERAILALIDQPHPTAKPEHRLVAAAKEVVEIASGRAEPAAVNYRRVVTTPDPRAIARAALEFAVTRLGAYTEELSLRGEHQGALVACCAKILIAQIASDPATLDQITAEGGRKDG